MKARVLLSVTILLAMIVCLGTVAYADGQRLDSVPGPADGIHRALDSTPTPSALPAPSPTPLPAPTPTGNPAPNSGGGSPFGFLPDPKEWAADVFNQVLVNLVLGLAQGLRQIVQSVLASQLNFISQTPPAGSYASPTVNTLWGIVRAIADGALVLIVVWGAFNLMAREHLHATYDSIMELIPRVVLGAVFANTSLLWMGLVIDANNALCSAIGGASLPAWEQANTASQVLVNVIAILIYLVTSLFLVLQMLMRMALLDVLIVTAPLGILCWILPQTQGWSQLWLRTFFTTVFVQFVQVLALKLGASLMTELAPMLPASAVLATLLGVAVLVLTMQLPGIIGRVAGGGLLRSVVTIAGMQAVRQVEHTHTHVQAGGGGSSGGGRP